MVVKSFITLAPVIFQASIRLAGLHLPDYTCLITLANDKPDVSSLLGQNVSDEESNGKCLFPDWT